MNPLRFFLLLSALAAFAGCATPRSASQHSPADQLLNAPVPPGHSRVIVFNSSSSMFSMDHADRINVAVDGRVLGNISHGEYAQVFLTPGRHDVALTRRAMVTYETEHPVLIDRPTRWLNIRSTDGGNLLDARDEPPAEFEKKYHPARD